MVTILFARRDSVYKALPNCDVWDVDRDALTWRGGTPVVAHPPCRIWGRLSAFAKAPESEKMTAFFAVNAVRRWGGVLEHPAYSKLWKAAGLPLPGSVDDWGGFTISVPQFWWGHRAEKWTWLYICGLRPAFVPGVPFRLGDAPCVIAQSRRRQDLRWRPEVSKAEREHTPRDFAVWLIELARMSKKTTAFAES